MNHAKLLQCALSLLALFPTSFAVSEAGAQTSSNLAVLRERGVKQFYANASTLLKDCGQPNYEYKTAALLFPVGTANEFYVVDAGLQARFVVTNGRVQRTWCGQLAAQGGTAARGSTTNTFLRYAQSNTSGQVRPTYLDQRGQLPSYRGALDLFVLQGTQASQAYVTSAGQTKCLRVVKQGLGISRPVITATPACS